MKKATKAAIKCWQLSRVFILPILLLTLQNNSYSQCTLSCEGTVQVSLDSNCEAVITPNVMLSDDGASCLFSDFVVELSNQYGPIPNNILTAANIGETITAKVLDRESGNSCWGYIILEDKLGPDIYWCPEGPMYIDCYSSLENLIEPIFMDACGGMVEAILLDQDIRTEDCEEYTKEIERVYYAKDSGGFESETCTVIYRVLRLNPMDIQCPSSYLVSDNTALDCDGIWKEAPCHVEGFEDFLFNGADRELIIDHHSYPSPQQAGNWTLSAEIENDNNAYFAIYDNLFMVGEPGVEASACVDIACTGTLYLSLFVLAIDPGFSSSYSINGIETELSETPMGPILLSIDLSAGDELCFNIENGFIDIYGISFWGDNPGYDPDGNGRWDDDNDGYPDIGEIDVPKINGMPIYPTPDWLCNAGVFYSDLQLPKIGCVDKIMRIWSIREWWCGDEYEETCTQIIEIKDITAPVVTDPDDLTISTNTTMAPFDTDYHGTVSCGASIRIDLPHAVDNCGQMHYDLTYPGGFKSDYDGTEYIDLPMGENQVTFTVYDECYNSSESTFTINVVDKTAPVTICDEFTVVALTHPGRAHVPSETFDDGSYDDCKLKKTLVRRMDGDENPCDCESKVPEFNDLHYIGAFEGHHYYTSKKNMTGYLAHKLAHAMGGYVMAIGSEAENDWITDAIQGFSDDEFFIGLNDANNEGFFYWPNGEAVDYLNWDLSYNPGVDEGDYVVLRKDGTWLDDMEQDDAKYIYELEDPCGFSSYVEFCCEDLLEDQMVVFRTVDSYGNYNDCMVSVEVQDKLIPRIECPEDMVVHCDQAYDLDNMGAFGEAFVTENCEATMVEIVREELNQCNIGRIVRTFIASNSQGVQDSCHQYITFFNDERFVYEDIEWPEDRLDYPGCDDPANFGPDVTGYPEFYTDVCDLVGANYDDQIFIFNGESDEACFKILRHWTVIDWCQTRRNPTTGLEEYVTWYKQQVIKIVNTEDPVIEECEDETICHYDPDCGDATITLSASASDECTTNLKWRYSLDLWANGTYDTISPVFQGVADSAGVTTASLTREIRDGEHIVLWTFFDNCGNLTTCSERIQIKNCKAATPYCINGLAVDLMPIDEDGDGIYDFGMVEMWAIDFDAGTEGPCDNDVIISFSSDIDSINRLFTCDDLGDQTVDIYATIIGANGELIQSFCETYVNIQDNNGACTGGTGGRISGNIKTEMNENIENVRVALEGSDEVDMTSNEGSYAFPDMPAGGAYTVNPWKNDDPLNGVSTLDLVLIQRHILGVQLLDSPYKIIAGDINDDQEISSIDLIELRKLILGIYDNIPNNNSWRFIDGDYTFSDPVYPLLENFDEVYDINALNSDMNINFTGVKVGDVNNSNVSNLLDNGDIKSRSSEMVDLEIRSTNKLAGNKLEIPVYAKSELSLYGMQFTFALHPDLSFSEVISGQMDLNELNLGFNQLSEGLVSFSWNNMNAVHINSETPMFTLVLDRSTTEDISYPLDINSELTQAEVYTELNVIKTPRIEYRDLNGDMAIFKLYQNIPNPFRSTTEIRFTLPADGPASLSITDVTGKLVKLIEGDYAKGMNTIELSSNDLDTNGFLYYTLKAESNKASKKMVLVK